MTTNEPNQSQSPNRDRLAEYAEYVRYRRLRRSRKHLLSMLLWIGVVIAIAAVAPPGASYLTPTEAAAWTGAVVLATLVALAHFAYALFLQAIPDHINIKTIKAALGVGGSHRE